MDKYELEAKELRKVLVDGGVNVEVGCGCRKIHPMVLGIDPIPKGTTANMNKPSVADIVGIASELNDHFEPNSVDSIVAGHAIHYEKSIPKTFEVFFSVLKYGGKVAVIDLSPAWQSKVETMKQFTINWFSLEECKKIAEDAGFVTIEAKEAAPGWSFVWSGVKPKGLKTK